MQPALARARGAKGEMEGGRTVFIFWGGVFVFHVDVLLLICYCLLCFKVFLDLLEWGLVFFLKGFKLS